MRRNSTARRSAASKYDSSTGLVAGFSAGVAHIIAQAGGAPGTATIVVRGATSLFVLPCGALVMVGPLPDDASLRDLFDELEETGLVYFDDYFELSGNWPVWLRLFVDSR